MYRANINGNQPETTANAKELDSQEGANIVSGTTAMV
jgi:hypothetical protein